MEPPDPLRDDELAALPVFPLPRVVFFPGTVLPLHLFEPRYRAMIEDCLTKGPRAMAVALLQPGWEADYEGRPPVHAIAGAGRSVEHVRRPDGRFDVLLHGLARVRLEELPPDRPYRLARATPLPDRVPHLEPVERLVPAVLNTASAVTAILRRRHPELHLGVDHDSAPGVLADRVADRLIADVAQRQALLEQPDVKVRLALLNDALLELLARLAPIDGPSH
jgi:Lon protease-like protein